MLLSEVCDIPLFFVCAENRAFVRESEVVDDTEYQHAFAISVSLFRLL